MFVVLRSIFVAGSKITSGYNFAAPLNLNLECNKEFMNQPILLEQDPPV